ncbi:hypothetical protein GCM10017559_00950 [Streptosporangium longisporum]|uniref:Uncharacterized protein n=1 Tax=Streptosporangium longisporum TaxID=46187 RepID=A0ABN3XPN8_9ACTN
MNAARALPICGKRPDRAEGDQHRPRHRDQVRRPTVSDPSKIAPTGSWPRSWVWVSADAGVDQERSCAKDWSRTADTAAAGDENGRHRSAIDQRGKTRGPQHLPDDKMAEFV